ncbi:hypothetical protein SNE40_011495 [Patella caerulea]|uniref:Uncharacterized protein n=1 Tax=Patella caerulea TaxID=87958 RepID=A0AAN8JS14_PATCE
MGPLNLSVMFYLTAFLSFSLCSADDKCGSNFSEGDKWFDGCNWCTCEADGQRCTKAVCSISDNKHPRQACKKPGESWRDGCFHCQCLPKGIRCKVNKRCVKSLSDAPADCRIPVTDQNLCICGLDGVPSCAWTSLSQSSDSQDKHQNGILLSEQQVTSNIELHDDASEKEYSDQPIPLIPSKEKGCHIGSRWYEGGQRCYCDDESGVTCGNPRFMARKVDGYKIRRKKCKAGKQWNDKCKYCVCKVKGLSFCRIDRICMRNKKIGHSSRSTRRCTGKSCNLLKLNGMTECKIGDHWKDGCKRCRCNKKGKPVCKSRHCNQSTDDKTDGNVLPSRRLPTGGLIPESKTPFKMPDKPRFRMPTFFPGIRFDRKEKPVPIFNCNGFKPGEKYWDNCNLCHCTTNGDPMCYSKLC